MWENIILLFATCSIMIVSLLIILYYLPIIKINTKQQKEASQFIKDIILDLQSRLKNQDEKLLDQQVRIDLIEIKLHKNKFSENVYKNNVISSDNFSKLKKIINSEDFYEKKEIVSSSESPEIISTENHEKRSNILNPTEIYVLKLMNMGLKTPKDIQIKINKSREHVSRLMKKLHDMHYVSRDKSKKPYRYELTNDAKNFI